MLPVYRLFGNIWRDLSKQNQGDSVGQLLAQGQNCTVEMLLDDEHTPTELRNNNSKLVNYFQKEKIMRLLHYIVVDPPEDADHKRGHKFPFQASELLSVEQNAIMDLFFVQTEKPKYPVKPKKHASPETSPRKEIESPTNEEPDAGPEQALTPQIENDSDEIVVESNGHKQTEEELEEPRESTSLPLPECIEATPTTDSQETEDKPEEDVNQTVAQSKPEQDNEEANEPSPAQAQFEEETVTPQRQEENVEIKEEVKEVLTNVEDDDIIVRVSDEDLEEEKMTMITGSTYADSQDQAVEMERRQELLDFLFSFIQDGEKELNPVLCGYFCKMVNCLLTKRAKQTLTYLFTHPNTLMNMVHHMESRGVYEILMRVLRIDSAVVEQMEVELSVQKARVIDFLVDQLSGDCTRWENINSATVLSELVENSQLWGAIIQDQELIKKTVSNIREAKTTSSLQSSLQFLTSMVFSTARLLTRNDQGASLNESDVEAAKKFQGHLLYVQIDVEQEEEEQEKRKTVRLDEIVGQVFKLFQNEPNALLEQSYGRSIIPFGKTRLQVVRLLCGLVELKDRYIMEFIVKTKVLKTVMNLVMTYEWNNLLHVLADRIFTTILEFKGAIRGYLIKEMRFADWIVKLANQGSFMFDSGRFSRTGYMPFANKLSNQLNKLAETEPEIETILKFNFAYNEYKMGDLATMNSLNTRSLGGYKTGPSGEEKKEDEDKQEEEKMDSNVSFGIQEIYKEFNELSARYNSSRENSVKSSDEEDEMECPISPEGSDESPDKSSTQAKEGAEEQEEEEEEEEDYQDHQRRFAQTMKNITDEQGSFEDEEEEEKVVMKDSAVGTETVEDEDVEFNDRVEDETQEEDEQNPFDMASRPAEEEGVNPGAANPDEADCDFYSNNYWKVEGSYDINEMMKDFI